MEKDVSVTKRQLGQCARRERERSERQPKRVRLQSLPVLESTPLPVLESTLIASGPLTVPMEIDRVEGETIVSGISEPIAIQSESRPIVTGSSSMAIMHDESNLNQSAPRSRCLDYI